MMNDLPFEFYWHYVLLGFCGGFAFTVLLVVGCMLLDRNATRHHDANELRGDDIRKVK